MTPMPDYGSIDLDIERELDRLAEQRADEDQMDEFMKRWLALHIARIVNAARACPSHRFRTEIAALLQDAADALKS